MRDIIKTMLREQQEPDSKKNKKLDVFIKHIMDMEFETEWYDASHENEVGEPYRTITSKPCGVSFVPRMYNKYYVVNLLFHAPCDVGYATDLTQEHIKAKLHAIIRVLSIKNLGVNTGFNVDLYFASTQRYDQQVDFIDGDYSGDINVLLNTCF